MKRDPLAFWKVLQAWEVPASASEVLGFKDWVLLCLASKLVCIIVIYSLGFTLKNFLKSPHA